VNIVEFCMASPEKTNLQSEDDLRVLREIEKNPELTQRELSSRLGISLGKINFLLKALIQKGFVKVDNFRKNNNKIAYMYVLTPHGLEVKGKTTYHFLKRKIQEYEKLEEEIRQLKKEVQYEEG
jgi:EPS-associated MarR family transcriptional regulator